MNLKKCLVSFFLLFTATSEANYAPKISPLVEEFRVSLDSKDSRLRLREKVLREGPKAVPALTEVIKGEKFPEKNRWLAIFLLGRVMGQKASTFISKFISHDHWMLRLASLKTLLALRDQRYLKEYEGALKDPSQLVRAQALQNVKEMKIKKLAPAVWGMLYDKDNYGEKRPLAGEIIETVGVLEFKKAQKPLLKMAQHQKYGELFSSINFALEKISKEVAPQGSEEVKKHFWRRYQMGETKI